MLSRLIKIFHSLSFFIVTCQADAVVPSHNDMDPLKQFEIKTLYALKIGALNLSITNIAVWIFLTTFLLCLFGTLATRRQTFVPNKTAYIFEYIHDFIANIVVQQVGKEGLKYFPFIFCLFLFIIFSNLLGMLPYGFTSTSHISVTFCLSLLVFLSLLMLSFYKHKSHFFRMFCPRGLPGYIIPIIVPVEILSYLARPVSLAIRLCANMIAGHVMIKLFASLMTIIPSQHIFYLGFATILLNVLLIGFEIFIAGLQAYIFTILTCIYLNDTLHLH